MNALFSTPIRRLTLERTREEVFAAQRRLCFSRCISAKQAAAIIIPFLQVSSSRHIRWCGWSFYASVISWCLVSRSQVGSSFSGSALQAYLQGLRGCFLGLLALCRFYIIHKHFLNESKLLLYWAFFHPKISICTARSTRSIRERDGIVVFS